MRRTGFLEKIKDILARNPANSKGITLQNARCPAYDAYLVKTSFIGKR